ncbi:V-type ATP synthase subunit E [Ruminococcaceae bacterium OttesenSCG-928-A16]|nr:V-type ATP synthase subunit E [Ruminococcaceae bacterium OttesenSCG-928-A16]
MDINKPEMVGLDNQFKTAVLDTAQNQAREIVARAEKKRTEVLHQARLQCAVANHDALAAAYSRKTEQQFAATAQQTRQQLLAWREELVQQVFAAAEQELLQFAAGPQYPAWLASKVAAHANNIGMAAATILLRAADMPLTAQLQKALPGSTVQQDDNIRLGGFKLAVGNRLYNETLEVALEQQKEEFYTTSGLGPV